MGAQGGDRAVAESQPVKRHYKRAIKRHYGGELRGLAHTQLPQIYSPPNSARKSPSAIKSLAWISSAAA
jgi:hypothetical protein